MPRFSIYKQLFRCFAGPVADLPLPTGAFFAGSSVLASVTLPAMDDAEKREIFAILDKYHWLEETWRSVARMSLVRRLKTFKVTFKVMQYVGAFTSIQDLRYDVYQAQIGKGEVLAPCEDADVLWWTENGFGPYARSDIDIMIQASTTADGDDIARQIYHMVRNIDGDECVAVKTGNTLTLCRSWPERHVQIVLLFLSKISDLLLFADLDCTAMAIIGGVPYTTGRSRRALSTRANIVPTSMLKVRRDTPKRVAQYARRGFAAMYVTDDRVDATEVAALMEKVNAEFHYKKKLLSLTIFDIDENVDGDEIDMDWVTSYLSQGNTSYSCFSIPRMIDPTAEGIAMFFQKLYGSSHNEIIVFKETEIPPVQHKLAKVSREMWTQWGMLRDADV